MSDPVENRTVRSMLEHQGWVRDLARRLVRDPDQAEDVAQNAWVAALEHPPGRVESQGDAGLLRPWLGAVTRNAARQLGRSESRRADRERRAALGAGGDTAPSTSELLERAALQRRVSEAVEHLAEPYRSTLLLRYFEELPPREIARRQGVPVETVRTRIGRGIDQLRSQLDGEFGDRRAWLTALAPIASLRPVHPGLPVSNVPVTPAALGAALVNTKLLLSLVGASALGLGALLMARSASSPAEPVVHAAFEAAEPEISQPRPSAAVPATAPRSEAEPAAVSASPTGPGAALVETAALAAVTGRVIDADGSGLAGVNVVLTTREDVLEVRARSGGAGRFELHTAAGHGSLSSEDAAWATVLASSWRRDQEREPVIVVAPSAALNGRVLDEAGGAIEGVQVSVALPDTFRARLDVVLDDAERRTWTVDSGTDGSFELTDVPLVAGAVVHARHSDYLPASSPLEELAGGHRTITLGRPELPDDFVGGVVLDPYGAPVADAYVALGLDTDVTGEDGTFGLQLDAADSMNAWLQHEVTGLTAVKRGYLPAVYAAPADGGGGRAWPPFVTLTLGGEPLELRGAVLDHRGDPVAGAIVWLADPTMLGAIDGSPTPVEHVLNGASMNHWESVEVDGNGVFLLEGLLDRDYLLRAMDPETLVHAEFGPFRARFPGAAGHEVELALPTDRVHPRVAGRVLSFAGEPVAGAAVYPQCDAYVSRAAGQVIGTSHSAREGVTTDAEGHFELQNVPESLVYLRVEGEDILPLEFGRVGAGPERSTDDVSGLPGESIVDLQIEVLRRAHLKVELTHTGSADQVSVLDAAGERLILNVMMARSRRSGYEMPIHSEGLSDTMAVPETGVTVVLLKAGQEVGRLPLALVPGEVTGVIF